MVTTDILDLAHWKLTLPSGEAEHPEEILAEQLLTGEEFPPFYGAGPDYVAFRAPIDGVTTSGSGYPRCELREMSGSSAAKWGGNDGKYHTMVEELAFITVPDGRPNVVGAQIHDAKDDYCVLRLEGNKLWLTLRNNTHYKLLDANYTLGKKVQIAFAVGAKKCKVYFNGNPVATLDASKLKGAYFKAGCYTQANEENADGGAGEVWIYRLRVSHGSKAGDIAFPPATTPPPPPPPVDPVPPVVVPPVEQPPTEPIPPVPVPPADMPASGWPRDPKQPKRVIIMLRHGEKDDDGDGEDDVLHELSETGKKRAAALKAVWSGADIPEGTFHPDRLVASKGTTASNRPLKTIEPIQLATGLPMNTKYDAEKDYKTLGPWLRDRLDVTMVCMEHSAIIDTFKGLGTIDPPLPKEWDSKRFDLYWVFTSDDGKKWKFTQIPEMLLPGDSDKPIK